MSAPTFKILIDFDEYLKLMTLKDIVKKQEEELKKHYETKSVAPASSKLIQNESLSKIKDENKVGAGAIDNFSEQKSPLIKEITAEVTKTLENYYNLKPISAAVKQEGSGAEDLIPQDPIPISNDNPIFPPVEHVEIIKSRLNDDFDVKKLLDAVPAEHLEKAETLLKKLDDFPNELTWDSSGTIYIDQHSLPESNIYDLFPLLFKKVAYVHKVLNLREVASKISSLGLGYLINSRLTSGLSRKRTLANHNEMFEKTKLRTNWWFLGNE